MPQPLLVRLGPQWARFSRPRDDITLLGTVQQHAAIGALALRPDGTYLQVNGDVEQELNASRVEKAIRSARGRSPMAPPARRPGGDVRALHAPSPEDDGAPAYQVPPAPPKTPVVVSIKRRRLPSVQGS